MIRVTLHYDGALITGFECKGHAGFAQSGQDIVCAAVSVLTVTCANALESVANLKPYTEEKEGFLKVGLPKNAGHDAQVILLSMRQGLRDIAENYPEFLQLNEKS